MPQSTVEAKHYIARRLLVFTVGPLWWVAILWTLYRMITAADNTGWIAVGALVPMVIPTILFIVTLKVFPWQYSALGRYVRTPFPAQPPLAVVAGVLIRIGHSRTAATWHVFKDGIGVAIQFTGSAYLSRAEFQSLTPARFGGAWLVHSSPEIRSPIFLHWAVVDAMSASWNLKQAEQERSQGTAAKAGEG